MREDATSDEPVRPEEVAEWLGLGPGETIGSRPDEQPDVARHEARQLVGCALLLAGMGGLASLPNLINALGPGPLIGAVVICSSVALAAGGACFGCMAQVAERQPWLAKGDPALTADGTGLTVAYRGAAEAEWFAWTEIAAMAPLYGKAEAGGLRQVERWVVHTETGRSFHFRADAPHADAIAEAARGVIEARNQGRPLWDPDAIPSGGLSRLTGVEEPPSEAGLSRVDE